MANTEWLSKATKGRASHCRYGTSPVDPMQSIDGLECTPFTGPVAKGGLGLGGRLARTGDRDATRTDAQSRVQTGGAAPIGQWGQAAGPTVSRARSGQQRAGSLAARVRRTRRG